MRASNKSKVKTKTESKPSGGHLKDFRIFQMQVRAYALELLGESATKGMSDKVLFGMRSKFAGSVIMRNYL